MENHLEDPAEKAAEKAAEHAIEKALEQASLDSGILDGGILDGGASKGGGILISKDGGISVSVNYDWIDITKWVKSCCSSNRQPSKVNDLQILF